MLSPPRDNLPWALSISLACGHPFIVRAERRPQSHGGFKSAQAGTQVRAGVMWQVPPRRADFAYIRRFDNLPLARKDSGRRLAYRFGAQEEIG